MASWHCSAFSYDDFVSAVLSATISYSLAWLDNDSCNTHSKYDGICFECRTLAVYLTLLDHYRFRQSVWAERERPICRSALKPILWHRLSAPAPRLPAPRSAPAQAFSGMSAHRSAPFSAPLTCSGFCALLLEDDIVKMVCSDKIYAGDYFRRSFSIFFPKSYQ